MVQHLVMFSGKIHPSHLIYILKLQVYIALINIYMHGLKDLIVIVITSSKHYDTFPILLETLQKQSEECSARLKPFYENLILRKIYDFYPRFINSQVDISVEQSRELCLKKMSIMEKSIPQNLYFEIYRREQAERNAFLNHQKQIRQGYESSVSWKITNPLRLIKKILKKEENKPTKLEIKSGISSVIESFEF